jgi:hypothetical protein
MSNRHERRHKTKLFALGDSLRDRIYAMTPSEMRLRVAYLEGLYEGATKLQAPE